MPPLTAEGDEVRMAFDGESALVAIEDHNPDVILLDVQSALGFTVL